MENNAQSTPQPGDKDYIRPEVMTYDDIRKVVPALDGHEKLVNKLFHLLAIDGANRVHSTYCDKPGIAFAHSLATSEYHWDVRIDNLEVLERFKEGPFITVSNHPFGSYDGVLLIDIVGSIRPDYKVMVNLILNQIQALRPCFIAVDPLKSDDPEKKKITMQGIRTAMKHVKEGHPLGFFPAGAVSKIGWSLKLRDRQWQPTIIRLIRQLQVPVIPIFFHGYASHLFNILGVIDWRLRTLRLPKEIMTSYNKKLHVSIGQPISVERQNEFPTIEELGDFLRRETYNLKKMK